jgi:hypothetical protein
LRGGGSVLLFSLTWIVDLLCSSDVYWTSIVKQLSQKWLHVAVVGFWVLHIVSCSENNTKFRGVDPGHLSGEGRCRNRLITWLLLPTVPREARTGTVFEILYVF